MKTYTFNVTSDPAAPDNVLLKFELSFAATCQVLKAIAEQNWCAAAEEILQQHKLPGDTTQPRPVVFSLLGTIKGADDQKAQYCKKFVNDLQLLSRRLPE